ncbi:MAG: heme ABC transporter permease [Gammaproteobacteria bacterium]|nr:heme ABC transporter permease [Gammaproteobacteria bacterium]
MSPRSVHWFKFSSPSTFYPVAGKISTVSAVIAVVLIAVGLYMSFFVAPTDYKQGEGYRIIFVHVPASWMSMFIYVVMAGWAAIGLVFNTRLSAMMAQALAPTGAMFAFLSLWTGSFWGKPMWGTWWVWDARITAELILLFLYLGYMALRSSIDDPRRGDRASAILLLVGVVNIPIIYYSVQWWNTLHQGATIKMGEQSSMDETMLITMLVMTFAFWAYAIAVTMARVRTVILERERTTTWVRELAMGER